MARESTNTNQRRPGRDTILRPGQPWEVSFALLTQRLEYPLFVLIVADQNMTEVEAFRDSDGGADFVTFSIPSGQAPVAGLRQANAKYGADVITEEGLKLVHSAHPLPMTPHEFLIFRHLTE